MYASDTLRISLETESRRGALLQALRSDPLVEAIAASSPATRGVISPSVPAQAAGPSSSRSYREAVSSEYFDVLGIDVVSGRGFTPAERTADAGVVVVSETLARQLWPNGDGVGQQVRLEAPQPASPDARPRPPKRAARRWSQSRTFTVVGVVRDPGSASGVLRSTRSGACTSRRVSRARYPGCCVCAATRRRRGRRCWNASRLSIRAWSTSSACKRSLDCRRTRCRLPSGSRSCWEDSRSR